MDQNIAQRKIKDLTSEVEAKVQQVGNVIQDLLFLLEMQEKGDWSEIIQKFTVLSGMFSTLQQILRKSGIDLEDNIRLLKMTQLVPQTVSIDPDPKLQEWTEGRLSSFNHNIVPILLRTKLKPEVEEDEGKIERDRSATKQVDVVKHIKSINSLIDMLCGKLGDFTKLHVIDRREQISFSQDETMKLVRAVCLGKGIQPKATTSQSAGESSKNNPTNAYQGKSTK